MEKKRILITGIPGTGKTEIGEYFQSAHEYKHVNCEKLRGEEELRVLIYRPDEFIGPLLKEPKNVIVTWGFVPGKFEKDAVIRFKDTGFRLFWFDGNRPAALRVFLNREKYNPEKKAMELAFYCQMRNIMMSNIVEAINPFSINTFDEKGEFKSKNQIYNEIISNL